MSRFFESECDMGTNGVRSPRAAAWVVAMALSLFLLSGCVAPGYSEEKEMLFEDTIHIEPRIGTFVPNDGNFDSGAVIATRVAYQYAYGSYISFDYSVTENVTAGSGAADASVSPSLNAYVRDAGSAALSEADRRALVLSFDWDYPLSTDETKPYLRWGLGVGILNTLNGTNPDFEEELLTDFPGEASVPIRAKDQAMFLVRPTIGAHWKPSENLALFADLQLDIAEHKTRITVNGEDFRTEIIDFGGLNLVFGMSYSF
ncbi:MAG: hypothetical protein ACYTGJ_02345 [Planctomycetota bacterium]|jgi:hypothetical protein